MMPCVRVLIADDQPRARHSLRALLDTFRVGAHCGQVNIQVVAEAENGQEAVRLACQYQPDVVMMDMQMPIMDGLAATRLIKAQCPRIRVVVLTMYGLMHREALEAGADGFLVKGCPSQELEAAILNPVMQSASQSSGVEQNEGTEAGHE